MCGSYRPTVSLRSSCAATDKRGEVDYRLSQPHLRQYRVEFANRRAEFLLIQASDIASAGDLRPRPLSRVVSELAANAVEVLTQIAARKRLPAAGSTSSALDAAIHPDDTETDRSVLGIHACRSPATSLRCSGWPGRQISSPPRVSNSAGHAPRQLFGYTVPRTYSAVAADFCRSRAGPATTEY